MEQNLYVVEMKNNDIRVIQATQKEIEIIPTIQDYNFFAWDNKGVCSNWEIRQLIGRIDTTK